MDVEKQIARIPRVLSARMCGAETSECEEGYFFFPLAPGLREHLGTD